jgi:hypothetical protein
MATIKKRGSMTQEASKRREPTGRADLAHRLRGRDRLEWAQFVTGVARNLLTIVLDLIRLIERLG